MEKDEKNCLILLNGIWGLDRYFIRNIDMEQVEVSSIYKLYNRGLKYLLAKLWINKIELPGEYLWYEEWKGKIESYDTIIVNAQNLSWKILLYIKSRNAKCRLIIWYWDTVDEKRRIPKEYEEFCEIWSFDEKDCKKYKMNRNEQFYLPLKNSVKEIKYDAMFLGRDKGRVGILEEICDVLQKKGLTVYKYIQRDRFENRRIQKNVKKDVEYEEVVDLVMKSRCVIDIPKNGQSGITLRVLEAIFYSKKLITTDRNIKKYDFYNRKNFFLWGEDDVEGIVEFINGEYEPVEEKIKNRYLFKTWLERFEI